MDKDRHELKPWLLNILACPIDKHHPLEAWFFSWETKEEEIHKIFSESGEPSPNFNENYRHLAKQILDGTISPEAMQVITDLTGSNYTKGLLEKAVEAVKRLEKKTDLPEDKLISESVNDIDTLYRFLNLLELDTGILICHKCDRWYPVGSAVETIPELLPDDLRERDRDLKWLKKWRGKVPSSVLERGKPFSLTG